MSVNNAEYDSPMILSAAKRKYGDYCFNGYCNGDCISNDNSCCDSAGYGYGDGNDEGCGYGEGYGDGYGGSDGVAVAIECGFGYGSACGEFSGFSGCGWGDGFVGIL